MSHENFYDVEMTDEQAQRAIRVGYRRHNEALRLGCKAAYGASENDLGINLLGALGELAYCLYTDQPWSESVNTFKAPDVGTNIQIRTTKRHNGRLIVRKKDKDHELFVLVIADEKKFKIVGSILGRDAKRDEFLAAPSDRPPAWFVDQSALTKIEDKRKKIESKCYNCLGEGRILIKDLDMHIPCEACDSTGKIIVYGDK